MKVPLEDYFVNKLNQETLPEIALQDVDNTLQTAEQEPIQSTKKAAVEHSGGSGIRESLDGIFKSPRFLLPARRFVGHSCTPPRFQKLVNLSFSQPSTPKTPAIQRNRKGGVAETPCIHGSKANAFPDDGFVIPTPMVLNAMDTLHKVTSATGFGGSDILDFLDDDSHDTPAIDNHIRQQCEVDLNDSNLIEYLLEITEDLTKSTQHAQRRAVHHQQYVRVGEDDPVRRRTRRKYAHSKMMTAEEEESIRRLQKQREKERRKERKEMFKHTSRGTRKSSRKRKEIKYY